VPLAAVLGVHRRVVLFFALHARLIPEGTIVLAGLSFARQRARGVILEKKRLAHELGGYLGTGTDGAERSPEPLESCCIDRFIQLARGRHRDGLAVGCRTGRGMFLAVLSSRAYRGPIVTLNTNTSTTNGRRVSR
jgi:hypothetical protein